MTPTEKHRETATLAIKEAQDALTVEVLESSADQSRTIFEAYQVAVATALAKAEREGMKRAAEIAQTVEAPEDGEYWIANRIASAILSEAGESE